MNYLDLAFLALLVFGAFLGFIVGARKSFRSLIGAVIIVVVCFVACAFFSHQIIDAALGQGFVDGLGSLEELPAYLANNDDEMIKQIGELFIDEESAATLLTEFGLVFIKLIVFLVLALSLFILKFAISIILYPLGLLFRLASKKKRKKKRLLGAVFGFATSAVICFTLSIPIVGLQGTVKKLAKTNQATELLRDIPLLEQLEGSVFLSTVGESALSAFDMLTSFDHNDVHYSLRHELENLADIVIMLEGSGLFDDGALSFETMKAEQFAKTIRSLADLIELVGKQKLLTSFMDLGVKFACDQDETITTQCDTFKILTIDFSEIDFSVEADAFRELATVYQLLTVPSAPTPEPAADLGDGGDITESLRFGFGMPDTIDLSVADRVVSYLNSEFDVVENGPDVPYQPDENGVYEDRRALNKSILFDTIIPNLLEKVFDEVLVDINTEKKVSFADFRITDEFGAIFTLISAIEDFSQVLESIEGDVDTVTLKKGLTRLASIPRGTATRQVIDIIITAQARDLFAKGAAEFNYNWGPDFSVLDNINEIISMIELANKMNNATKNITELTEDEILDMFTDLQDLMESGNSELVSTMLEEMVVAVAGENALPVDLTAEEYKDVDFVKSADIYLNLKNLAEAGPVGRDPEDIADAADDLLDDPFALNIVANSGTVIPVTRDEHDHLVSHLSALGIVNDPLTGANYIKYRTLTNLFKLDENLSETDGGVDVPDPEIPPLPVRYCVI